MPYTCRCITDTPAIHNPPVCIVCRLPKANRPREKRRGVVSRVLARIGR